MSETASHHAAWEDCRNQLADMLNPQRPKTHTPGRNTPTNQNSAAQRTTLPPDLWEQIYQVTDNSEWQARKLGRSRELAHLNQPTLSTIAKEHLGDVGLASMDRFQRAELTYYLYPNDLSILVPNPDEPDATNPELEKYKAYTRLTRDRPDTTGLDLHNTKTTVDTLGPRLGPTAALSGLAYLVHATLCAIDQDITDKRPDFGVHTITAVLAPLLTLTKAARLLRNSITDETNVHPSAQNELERLTQLIDQYHEYLTQAITNYEMLRNQHIQATTEIDLDMQKIRDEDTQWEQIVDAATLISETAPPPQLGATGEQSPNTRRSKSVSARTNRKTHEHNNNHSEEQNHQRSTGYAGPWTGW